MFYIYKNIQEKQVKKKNSEEEEKRPFWFLEHTGVLEGQEEVLRSTQI